MPEDTFNNPFDPNKEQAILASFSDPDVAKKAAQELKNQGIKTVQIDSVSRYAGEPTQQLMNPITGEIPSMVKLTQGTVDFSNDSARVLAGADPSVYAMAGPDMVAGENILMTVVCPKEQTEQAVQTIRSFGGNT